MAKDTIQKRLDHTAGIDRYKAHVPYAGGDNGQSELARKLTVLLEGADWDRLSGSQIDLVERILSGGLGHINGRFVAEFFRVRPWGLHQGPTKGSEHNELGWCDHVTKLISKESGRVYYRSQPYELDSDDILALAKLIESGHKVTIGKAGDYFPGRSFPILVEMPVTPANGKPKRRKA